MLSGLFPHLDIILAGACCEGKRNCYCNNAFKSADIVKELYTCMISSGRNVTLHRLDNERRHGEILRRHWRLLRTV